MTKVKIKPDCIDNVKLYTAAAIDTETEYTVEYENIVGDIRIKELPPKFPCHPYAHQCWFQTVKANG